MFILVSDILIVALLLLYLNDWRGSPETAEWIVQNRPAVSITVQLLSHIMGLAMLQSLCTIVNLSTRVALAADGVSLDRLRLANTICSMRIDWSLRYTHLSIVLAWALAVIVPGALWAGAITPVPRSAQHVQSLAVPLFDDDFGIALGHASGIVHARNSTFYKSTAKGTFTFAADLDLQGLILNLAQDASDRRGGISNHQKLDKTGYVYVGRSYGVGSGAGLAENFEPRATFYQYNETGLLANTICSTNSSSDWRLDPDPSADVIRRYTARGTLPSGSAEFSYPVAAWGDQAAFALGEQGVEGEHNFVAFATSNGADPSFGALDKVQCETRFVPTVFSIDVNQSDYTITVLPIRTVDPFLHSTDLAARVQHMVGTVGSMLGATIWIPVLGEVFRNNVLNVEAYNGPGESSTHIAVAMSLESIFDGFLEAISAAQIEVLNSTRTVNALTLSDAYVLGAFRAQLAVFALSATVTLLFVVEAIRTRFWSRAAKLNFMDIKSTIVATSIGGKGIAKRAYHRTPSAEGDGPCLQDGTFNIVAQDGQSSQAVLVVAAEAYHLVSYGIDASAIGD
jgi:hypothetical protein